MNHHEPWLAKIEELFGAVEVTDDFEVMAETRRGEVDFELVWLTDVDNVEFSASKGPQFRLEGRFMRALDNPSETYYEGQSISEALQIAERVLQAPHLWPREADDDEDDE